MEKIRKPLIAANIKMNNLPEGALNEDSPFRERGEADVIVIPSMMDIQRCLDARLITGAQNGDASEKPYGAFTGSIGMKMLADRGVRYVLCGHSERRKAGETNKQVIEKAIAALEAKIHPIICVGETISDRRKNRQEEVVSSQLDGIPFSSDGLTIAYEPVWAIGTNITASPEDAQHMHAFIRSMMDNERGKLVRILYGGSVKPDRVSEQMIAMDDIDGFLVGGSSLILEDFRKIVDISCNKI